MANNSRIGPHSTLLLTVLAALLLVLPVAADAQEAVSDEAPETATATSKTKAPTEKMSVPSTLAPVFSDYRGVSIGMSADEVRNKLDHLKEKGKVQDFFVFSDSETAQVYYDGEDKVMAVSVNYVGDDSNAPQPAAVLGEEIQARPDGSVYELKRYPAAGYWVSYSRTAGKNPIITVTMRKMM